MAYRSHKNKENQSTMKSFTNTITNTFRVKKCLFESPKSEPGSPKPGSPLLMSSPDVKPMEESPYALFQMRKRRQLTLKTLDCNDTTPLKRLIDPEIPKEENQEDIVMGTPENTKSIKQAVQKSMADGNLTGDFSKALCLPVISGSHPDLKTVAPSTVAQLLQKDQPFEYMIIDCRYPYEYEGGHIRSAVNMYFKNDVEKDFFNSILTAERKETNRILIMYCEFSSQRAPSMLRFLRSVDRDKNKDHYPFLYYPELYLIEGGYKAFYTNYKELCDPAGYMTMLDKGCSEELTFFRSKCKSWSVKSKRGKRTRSTVKVERTSSSSKLMHSEIIHSESVNFSYKTECRWPSVSGS